QAAGIPGLWRDLDLNSFIPVGLAHSFEQIHLLERFELYLKHLAEHVLALSGGVDQPWRVALTNQIERIPLVGDEDARHADSSIGTEVRETFLEGAEDEDKHGLGARRVGHSSCRIHSARSAMASLKHGRAAKLRDG